MAGGRPASAPKKLQLTVKCPSCGVKNSYVISVPFPRKYKAEVTCLKCGHEWTYEGILSRRIECPMCGSTRNDVNRRVFGKWKKERL